MFLQKRPERYCVLLTEIYVGRTPPLGKSHGIVPSVLSPPSLHAPREFLSPALMATKKVAIVGGGCSGLALLWALRTSNHEVHLFESSDHLGSPINRAP